MSIANIVAEFEALGIYLWAENEQLKFKAPVGVLTDSHKQTLIANKSKLIDFLSDPVVEAIVADEANRYEPFPLTDLQLAYLVGRNNVIEHGGVGCHSYIELDLPATDGERLEQAWHKLIARHDMLRAVISQDGTQQVKRTVNPPALAVHDYRNLDQQQVEQSLLTLRDSLAHRHYQPEVWPQYQLHLSQLATGSILHFSIDLLIADFASIQILLAELGELYNNPERELAPLRISYRDVVLARRVVNENLANDSSRASERYQRHKDYWLDRIDTMPLPPELPMAAKSAEPETEVTFNRLHFTLPADKWQALKHKANERQLTPSSVVLSAFTEVLGRWSRNREFCLNLTMLNRSTAHPDIRGVVGDFIAVNVLGVTPDLTQGFADRSKSLQQRLWQDLEHSSFSGVEVLREMSRQRQSNVIVPIVYTSTLGLSGDGLDSNEFMHDAQLRYGITQTPQVWLDCQATERGDSLIVDWDVRAGVFQGDVIEQAHSVFGQLIELLADDESIWSAKSAVALPAPMQALRQQFNDTALALPVEHLHSGFCRHALQSPTATALICDEQEFSYSELAGKALAVSRVVAEHCTAADRVAIVMDKGVDQIAAVLGVLLADCTYVPIDSAQPLARRDSIITDAGTKLVLTEHNYAEDIWPASSKVVNAEQLTAVAADEIAAMLTSALEQQQAQQQSIGDKIGYIIYTSGTTGKPKGVEMSHLGAMNTLCDVNRRFDVNADDKVLALVSYAFDLSIWDIFGTFAAGATLVMPTEAQRASIELWAELIIKHQVSLWNSVPAQLQMLVTQLQIQPQLELSSLRLAMLSGDWIPVGLPKQANACMPSLKVISLGGPTETAIWCVNYPIEQVAEDAYSIPYGTPLANHRIYLLNDHLEPCPDWVTGEMYIAGDGLAAGYAGDPQKTAERFITHPVTGERLYRSGDLGRLMPEGLIEIQGRDDGQVKINGHRIETGEVEAAIRQHPAVHSAAVVAIGEPLSLAAAVVLESVVAQDQNTDQASLLDLLDNHILNMLPAYMLPANMVLLDELPKSSNSKVDRKQLKQLLSDNLRRDAEFEAPFDTDLEQTVARIWREQLSIEQISRNDDFFKIGGSSLNAINLLSAYLAEGFSADIDLVFNQPVFKDMVAALEQSNAVKEQWLDSIDLQAMANTAMANLADCQPATELANAKRLFFTGATGYLGSYVLRQLLETTDLHIICLMRCSSEANGLQRLVDAAQDKGLPTEFDTSRLTIVAGAMDKPQFGLDAAHYQSLAEQADVVLHNASIINLMDPLSGLYPTNVEGPIRVIEFATTAKVKPVHYVSTIGIHHALADDVPQPVLEQTPAEPWRSVDLTYEQSKMMAETLFTHARDAGVPMNILRPGTITWARTHANPDAPFINDDAFLKFFRACLSIDAYPSSDLAVNIVPVDFVAECIAAIVKAETGNSRNFHIVSNESSQVETMYQWFNELGCDFEGLEFTAWKAKLNDNFVRSFVDLYFKNGMEGGGHHQYSSDNMQQVLQQQHIANFSVHRDYLQPLITKYLKA